MDDYILVKKHILEELSIIQEISHLVATLDESGLLCQMILFFLKFKMISRSFNIQEISKLLQIISTLT